MLLRRKKSASDSDSHTLLNIQAPILIILWRPTVNPLSAGDAFKRIHTVFPQLKFDRN